MAAVAAAAAWTEPKTGVVFVDDYDRTVERAYANALLRPRFAREVLVRGTVADHLKYWTDDASLECVLPRASHAPAPLSDIVLKSDFRDDGVDAARLGFTTPGSGAVALASDEAVAEASARLAGLVAALEGPVDPSWAAPK